MVDLDISIAGVDVLREFLNSTRRLSQSNSQSTWISPQPIVGNVVNRGAKLLRTILGKIRILKYGEDWKKKNHLLKYSEIPSFLKITKDEIDQQKLKKMIIRFDYFLSEHVVLTNPLSWDKSVFWLNGLIDAFLSFNWKPDWESVVWIEAGIAFSTIPLASSDDNRHGGDSNLLSWLNNDFGLVDDSSTLEKSDPNMFVKLVQDATKTSKNNKERSDVREFTYKFAMSLLLSLSFSVAVLQNLHQHFKSVLEEEQGESNVERKRERITYAITGSTDQNLRPAT